jgi:hypothetical protein
MIDAFLKAVRTAAPPPQRREMTYDVTRLSLHFASLGPNASLSLDTLRTKAVCLLAVSLMARSSDLARILRDNGVRQRPDGSLDVRMWQPKEWRAGSKHADGAWSRWMLIQRHEDALRCPVAAVLDYMQRTAACVPHDRRLAVISETESTASGQPGAVVCDSGLFLASSRPNQSLSSQAIAKIIKKGLGMAGIDVSEFSAHSVRSAAASDAIDRGRPIMDVMNAGRWSSASTFLKFYARAVSRPRL